MYHSSIYIRLYRQKIKVLSQHCMFSKLFPMNTQRIWILYVFYWFRVRKLQKYPVYWVMDNYYKGRKYIEIIYVERKMRENWNWFSESNNQIYELSRMHWKNRLQNWLWHIKLQINVTWHMGGAPRTITFTTLAECKLSNTLKTFTHYSEDWNETKEMKGQHGDNEREKG